MSAACDLANPRALARRARLLGPAGALELAGRGEAERGAALAAAPWGRAWQAAVDAGADPLDAADTVLAGAAADAALVADRFLSGGARTAFRAVLLLDAAAELKAVLRGLAAGDAPDRAAARARPLPGLSAAALRAVAAVPLPRAPEALRAAGSPLDGPLAAALAARGDDRGLLRLEAALDRATASLALSTLRRHGAHAGVARRAIALRCDHLNAALVLVLGATPLAPDWLVPGGGVPADAWVRAAATPPADRPEAVARALRGRRGPPGPEELADPARAEATLERLRERALAREARAEPLGIAVPLAWVAAARAEARRLRVALRGAAFGLAPTDLVDLLEG